MTPQPHPPLLPCPFCGAEAILMQALGEYWVRCENNHASAMAATKKQAIESWNQRPEHAKEESKELGLPESLISIGPSWSSREYQEAARWPRATDADCRDI